MATIPSSEAAALQLNVQQKNQDIREKGLPTFQDHGFEFFRLRNLSSSLTHEGLEPSPKVGVPYAQLSKKDTSDVWNILQKLEGIASHRFVSLQDAQMASTRFLRLSKSTEETFLNIEWPIQSDAPLDATDIHTTRSSRLIIVVEKKAQATLVMKTKGQQGYLLNVGIDVLLEPQASLNLIQRTFSSEGNAQVLHHQIRVLQEQGSQLRVFASHKGSAIARAGLDVCLAGEESRAELLGRFHGTKKEHSEFHVNVSHQASYSTSHQYFKSIAEDEAQSVFCGTITVNEGVNGVAANQLFRSLLVGEQATIHSRPQLRIHSNDVKCSHGAAIGRLRPEEVFYLRSRGIREQDARRILTQAFLDDVLEDSKDLNFRSHLETYGK